MIDINGKNENPNSCCFTTWDHPRKFNLWIRPLSNCLGWRKSGMWYHNEVTLFLKGQSHFFLLHFHKFSLPIFYSCSFVTGFFMNITWQCRCMKVEMILPKNLLPLVQQNVAHKKLVSFGTFKLIPYLHKNLFTMNFPVQDVIRQK